MRGIAFSPYERLIRPLLFKADPEFVHNTAIAVGERLGAFGFGRMLARVLYGYRGNTAKVVDGNYYRTPVVLAAGFDCNGRLTRILPSLSFGGMEIGSLTARPCEGNPKPRLTRLKRSESILVNKGLKNEGVDAIITRLESKPRQKGFVRGISIARTNDAASAPIEAGIEDYYTSLKKLAERNSGDYYTINISCPNAFGGESFTEPALLRRLLRKLRTVPLRVPLYVKMPIHLPWDEFRALLDVLRSFRVNGVVIGNLNKQYADLQFRDEAPAHFSGGLSGRPCAERSDELIKKMREAYGNAFTIIGCGGIFSPEDAMRKFAYGADLVQLITGMIFRGPGLMQRICAAYEKKLPANAHDVI